MHMTPKLTEAVQLAAAAPAHTLVRCREGFRMPRSTGSHASITRRTANVLVNAQLADFNERMVPSSLTLTPQGIALALSIAPQQAAA